ncbi:pentatricopeptide repeat-containing protein [Tanacetum coccineum]
MAWSLVRTSIVDLSFIRSSSSLAHLTQIYLQPGVKPICGNEVISYNYNRVFLSDVLYKKPLNFHLKYFCNTVAPRKLSWDGSSHDILLKNLESYIKNHQVDEAWESYIAFKRLYGLPDDHIFSRFITELYYTREPKWLQRACDIIFSLPKKKSNVLHFDLLYNLSISLARAQMPIPASMSFWMMIEKDNIPPTNLLGPFMLHIVKKDIGAYLASNILIQICDHFQHSGSNRSTIKPDTAIFNLVLDACSRHYLTFKAQKIIELMSQVGVVGDAYTIITIARIHAATCQRDELKKFQHCVDQVACHLVHRYYQFYDSLMSLHLTFNDIDSASKLIYDIISLSGTKSDFHKPFLIPLGSRSLKEGLKLQVLPHLLQESNLVNLEGDEGLVMHKNRKLVISNKTIAKLIVGYKRQGRISELSKVLYRIQTEKGSVEMNNLSSDVVDACIHVGWLETAHDILDDIERMNNFPNPDSYASLIAAYRKCNKHREAEALLRQKKKNGILVEKTSVSTRRSDLIAYLVQEMRQGEKDCSVHQFNSSIYFFMKAKMIDDALKTYKSMQQMKVYPTAATYIYMVMGYSSLEMYREVTHLWGDIWRSCDDGNLSVNIDLYEVLVLSFLKGGYFERVMEVIGCMKKRGMCPDKCLYRSEFLKLHKGLYSKLKASNARNEAQSKRIEHVKAFRQWAGIT